MQERSDSAQVLGNSPGVLGSCMQELSKCRIPLPTSPKGRGYTGRYHVPLNCF